MDKKVSYMLLKTRQSKYIKAYAILFLILAVFVGFYTYKKWEQYSLMKRAVTESKAYISALSDKVTEEKSAFEVNKEDADKLNEEIEEKLANIFPASDDYTNLTRELDGYEKDLSTRSSTFEVSNISYESVSKGENYSVLPLRMNIRSSAENFKKFLHLVENSGALSGNTRLMDISSIRLNFEKDDKKDKEEKPEEIINFTVQINAYFQ